MKNVRALGRGVVRGGRTGWREDLDGAARFVKDRSGDWPEVVKDGSARRP